MRKAGPLTLAGLFSVSLLLPQAAYSQAEQPQATTPERNAAKAPVPPGIPTNDSNVHLPTEGEVKLGREGAQEVEKYYNVETSGPYHERLQRISRDVTRAIAKRDIIEDYKKVYNLPRKDDKARRVPFEWNFKVISPKPRANATVMKPGKEVNAFSLAAGYIFVTRDLMDVASDDELAAVVAHECAHVAYHHVEQLVKKQRKLNSKQLWGLLATVIAGAAGGGAALAAASNVMLGAQLVSIATLTGYGRDLEREADRAAVMALAGTDYNPVGMLTFMQKLQKEDALRGYPDGGIFQSHPYTNERVAAIRKNVEAFGYKTDLGSQRQVSGTFRVTQEPQKVAGKPAVELRLNGNVLFTVVAAEGSLSPRERAQKIASQVEQLFTANLTYNDVRKGQDKTSVHLKGVPVIRVFPEDAVGMDSAEAVADRAYKEIIRALLKEQIEKPF